MNVIYTPYSFNIQKYGKQSCKIFKPIRSPVGDIRGLLLQQKPTPIHDRAQPGNSHSQKEVLISFHGNISKNILTDLSYLTSNKNGIKNTGMEKEEKVAKKKIDTLAGNTVSKWATRSVIRTVTCGYCSRPHCLFSK